MSRVDNAIRAAAGVTVVGLAGIAGAISYSHMTELAHEHGEVGWRAHMFPLSVDGIEIVASLVLLAEKRANRHAGRLPWAALIAGTCASFAANIAVGGSDWIGRAVSGWPAFALLIAVKLLFGLLEQPTIAKTVTRAAADQAGASAVVESIAPGTAPAVLIASADDVRDVRDDHADEPDAGQRTADEPTPLDKTATPSVPMLPSTVDVSDLLPAARAARAKLIEQGESVSRDALARQLRADGHAASNSRVSALLKSLLTEDRHTDAA